MPKHKKASSSESDSDSGPDDRNPPKKHASGKSKDSKDSKPDPLGWHLGNNRFANVKEFKGKIMVNIREYYEKDGEMLPGKKGISLTASQWRAFKEHIEDLDKQVSELA